ncbi:MAG: M16 family metallopeptidase [Desulfopila sp.]
MHFRTFFRPLTAAVLFLLFFLLFGQLGLAWSGGPCLSPGWPSDRSDLSPDPALVRGILGNGLRYVVMENHEPENRVGVYLYVHTGSLNETEAQRGVAHFLEHMQFNGTSHFPPGELVKFFQNIGMSFGGDTNASTGYDQTVYRLDLPFGSEEYLRKGFLVMADYARGALLADEEVDRERGVILAEKRTRDSAGYRQMVAANRFKYRGTLLPEREVIGRDAVLETADGALLRSYYDAWYRPDNMMLVVVGDLAVEHTVTLIKEMFGPLRGEGGWPTCPDIGEVASTGLRAFFYREPDLGRTTVAIESIRNDTPGDDSLLQQRWDLHRYASILLLNNRLDRIKEEPGGVFTQAGYYSGSFLGRIHSATIMATTGNTSWQEILAELDSVLRQALVHGAQEAELARIKKDILASLNTAVLTVKNRDSQQLAAEIIRQFNDNRVFLAPEEERDLFTPMVEAMTLADIDAALRADWPAGNRVITVSGDVQIDGPQPERQILASYATDTGRPVAPYRQQLSGTFPYLAPAKKSGEREPRVEMLPEISAERLELANDITVLMKSTLFEKNTVRLVVQVGLGKISEPVPGLALLAGPVVNDSGTARFSATELTDFLAGSTVKVNFAVDEESFNYSGKAVTAEAELMFQLVYHLLVDPGLRKQSWDRTMDRLQQMYDTMASDVGGPMRTTVPRFLAGGDPRVGLPPWTEVKKLRVDQLHNWLLPQIANGPIEVAIVGDFALDTMKGLVKKYFGSLDKRASERPGYSTLHFPKGEKMTVEVPTKVAKSIVMVAWPTADFWDIQRTRRLQLLADIFAERLRQVIREKLGASYSPTVFSAPSRVYRQYGRLQAQVVVEPGREREIAAEIARIARTLHDGDISEDELERARRPVMTQLDEAVKTNGYWLNSVLVDAVPHPEQLLWPRTMREDISAITVEQMKALASRYLVAENMAVATVRPKAEEKEEKTISQ